MHIQRVGAQLSNGVLSQPHIPLKFPREFLRFIPPEDKLSLAPDGAVSPWLGAAPGSVAFQPWADGTYSGQY